MFSTRLSKQWRSRTTASRSGRSRRANGYQFIVIADHGNADFARHPDGSPHTAHTTNPVPVVVLSEHVDSIQDGILADVAPTVLKLMGIPQPPEMTGTALH